MIAAQAPGPDKSVTRDTIEAEIVRQMHLEPGRAGRVLAAVGSVIADSVSTGQMDDVRRQLSRDLREVFSSPSANLQP